MATSRVEIREQIAKNNQERRKVLRQDQEEVREAKIFDFDVKRKELEWLLQMYNDPEEITKINAQLAELEAEKDLWLFNYENQIMDEEKEVDDREEEEENRLSR